ncbi:MAG: DUF1475 family protein [Eubacteriales bacterium]
MSKRVSITLQIIFFAAFIVLLAAIVYGVVERDIMAEGSVMLDIFWGQFTFVDIYVSFIVFYLWVIFREKSALKSIIWFVLIMFGGSMAICLYLFLAVRSSKESWGRLLAGNRMEEIYDK